MTLTEILQFSGTLLGSLGGGAVVIFGLSNYLGKRWADRMIEKFKAELQEGLESHKVALRKSEFLFQKEYEAVSGLWSLARAIHPGHTRNGMDWEDAGGDVAMNFITIEKKIDDYLRCYSASIDDGIRKELNELLHIAGQGKVYDGNPTDLWESGGDVLLRIEKVAQKATDNLRGQIKS
jgi:hypothetical protein